MNSHVPAIGGWLALILSLASGCGGWIETGEYQRKEDAKQHALRVLNEQGGKCEEKMYAQAAQIPGMGQAWAVDLSGAAITDETLKALKDLGMVGELTLSRSSITDEQLIKIDETISPSIGRLDLSETKVTDKGIGALKNFNFLMELNLKGTQVTDEGLSQLKKNRQGNNQMLMKLPKIRR